MRILLSWLREFVEIPFEPRKLQADLTSIGLSVEAVTSSGSDWLLDVEVTTNRPDCLSHYGVAREIAAAYRTTIRPLKFEVQESAEAASERVSIEISDSSLCARYCGRIVEGVRVGPSPEWLARRLEAIGQRPINNIADITNYVLMELGHPLHAFDFDRIQDRRIIVRRARAGELLQTLDGIERRLTANDLVIADAARPVALAGVMGGQNSEISPQTRVVLLESAWFDPVSVRRTAKSQGLHTEASHRFERGADIGMAPVALDRAAAMVAELSGGKVLRGRLDVYPAPQNREAIVLRQSEIARVLGTEIAPSEVERILVALGFAVEAAAAGWCAQPPSFRLDVRREVDLIEEVARQFGYDRLPARVRSVSPRLERDVEREKILALSRLLTGLGYREIIPSSMVDPKDNALFTNRPPVALANPLSQDASVLRSTSLVSMASVLAFNTDRGQKDLSFFELGKTYEARANAHPAEHRVLALGLTGNRRPPSVHEPAREAKFFDLKGDVESVLELFELPELRFEEERCLAYEEGLAGRFVSGTTVLAALGRLKPDIQRRFKIRAEAWLAEIDLDQLLAFPLKQPMLRPFSRFPTVERDLSLVVPMGLPYRRIAEAIARLGIEEIYSVEPLERKAAAELPAGLVPEGHASLFLHVTFQSLTRTLTGDEVDEAAGKIYSALESLGVRLRA